jgi:hypothetical protein
VAVGVVLLLAPLTSCAEESYDFDMYWTAVQADGQQHAAFAVHACDLDVEVVRLVTLDGASDGTSVDLEVLKTEADVSLVALPSELDSTITTPARPSTFEVRLKLSRGDKNPSGRSTNAVSPLPEYPMLIDNTGTVVEAGDLEC